MKLIDAFRINNKKLRFRTGKALFLILPITILVFLSIIISSQVKNFQKAIDKNIFNEIAEENTLIELRYQVQERFIGGRGKNVSIADDTQYTQADLEKIKTIENVEDAAMNYQLPISNIKVSDLFEDQPFNLMNLSSLHSNMAGIYTSEDFDYKEGGAIPIVINANSFIRQYEDWGGKEEISIDFRALIESNQSPFESTPVKTSAIDYDKEDLIGKEFSMTFGGFSDIQTFETSREDSITKYTKLSDAEIATKEKERKDAIDKYWDYDKLSEGVTYKFKVVGVIESEDSFTSYVPEDFASKLMSDYVALQVNTLRDNNIDKSLLNSTFNGFLFDGTEIKSPGMFGFSGPKPAGGFVVSFGGPRGADNEDGESYDIPGLVIEVSEDDSSEVIGIYKETDVFSKSVKSGDTITIKVKSIYDRAQVVEDMNALGFAYQDTNDFGVFEEVQSNLNSIFAGVVVSFIVLSIGVIMLAMSRFVADSRKEIGIFRAVGFTKRDILTIFLAQSIVYTLVGYLVGLILGFGGNLLASGVMSMWFDSFVDSTVRETFNVVGDIDHSMFTQVDLGSLALLTGILLAITLVISLIPAMKASNVSPVEAIRND